MQLAQGYFERQYSFKTILDFGGYMKQKRYLVRVSLSELKTLLWRADFWKKVESREIS